MRSLETTGAIWQKNPDDPDAAWQYARACYDLAEIDERNRASLAQQGIDACRKALRRRRDVAGTHYYLALNLGQLARTKKLGALRLVAEMEHVLRDAIKLDPKFDYAGPHRTLGLLYRDAPGWPTSIGSRSRAKTHLVKAVDLVPEFPENHLSLIESYTQWGEMRNARSAAATAESKLRDARMRFTGDRWKGSWRDWDARWEKVCRKTQADLAMPRGKP